jgi:uncharacterized RDD family membrane protein YckC
VQTSWKRLVAWLIDWAVILVWVAVVAAIGVPLYLAGITHFAGAIVLNIVSGLLIVVPVTVGFAIMEAGSRSATLGKRVMGLRVAHTRGTGRVGFSRSLFRNSLKIAVPWLIGHSAVFALIQTGGRDGGAVALIIGSYVLPILYVASLFVKGGRTPYDRLSGTEVRQSPTERA